jgi:hypothetical protein
LHREISSAVSDRALASAKEWVIRGYEIVSPGGGNGHTQPVKKFIEFRYCMGGTNAGARENHWTLRVADMLKNFATR